VDEQRTWRDRAGDIAAVLAALALVATVVSWWSNTRIYDSERFASAVEVALDDPVVVDAVAVAATDQLVDLVLAVSDPRQVLPGPLQDVGSGVEGMVRGFLADQMARLVGTEPVRRVLVTAVREAHGEVVVALRDGRSESGVLVVDDQIVRLDLTGVMAAGLDALVERRLLPGGLGGLQERLRGGLDSFERFVFDTLGLEAGGRLGTVVVYDANTVDQGGLALRSARWFSTGRLATGHFAVFALLAGAVAFGVGPNRKRSLVVLGGSIVAASLASHLYVGRVGSDLVDVLGGGAASRIAEVVIGELRPSLTVMLLVTAVVGAGLALASRSATRPRTRHDSPV
jgi:hypothetical protein